MAPAASTVASENGLPPPSSGWYLIDVPMMRRRASAVLLVLTMLLSFPVAGIRRCLECPPDCPMHTAAVQTRKPHCHESGGHQAESAGPCMRRAACGHTAPELVSAVPGVLPQPALVTCNSMVTAVPPLQQYMVGEADPEPATGPPRASVRWV